MHENVITINRYLIISIFVNFKMIYFLKLLCFVLKISFVRLTFKWKTTKTIKIQINYANAIKNLLFLDIKNKQSFIVNDTKEWTIKQSKPFLTNKISTWYKSETN